jgi:hypothetical protein
MNETLFLPSMAELYAPADHGMLQPPHMGQLFPNHGDKLVILWMR